MTRSRAKPKPSRDRAEAGAAFFALGPLAVGRESLAAAMRLRSSSGLDLELAQLPDPAWVRAVLKGEAA